MRFVELIRQVAHLIVEHVDLVVASRVGQLLSIRGSQLLLVRKVLGNFSRNFIAINLKFDLNSLPVLFAQNVTVSFEQIVEIIIRQLAVKLLDFHVLLRVREAALRPNLSILVLRVVERVQVEVGHVAPIELVAESVLLDDAVSDLKLRNLHVLRLLIAGPWSVEVECGVPMVRQVDRIIICFLISLSLFRLSRLRLLLRFIFAFQLVH